MKVKNQTNSYLTFQIGNEEFGAHVSEVLNILEMREITQVPDAPGYMKGVINLRGIVLPVIDTRIKFNMSPTQITDNTCIVVMDINDNNEIIHIGALVDSVIAVREFEDNEIHSSPKIGNTYKSEFIKGVVETEYSFIMILDLIKLFTSDELNEMKAQPENIIESN